MKKILKYGIVAMVIAVVLSACSGNSGKKITVGSKNFTEQYLLSKMTVYLLEDNGFDVDEKSDMGSSVLRESMLNNQVDMVWDYTGTVLVTYMGEDPVTDEDEAYEKTKELDEEKNDITWLNKTEVNNTYAVAMKESDMDDMDIHSMTDLAEYVNDHPDEMTLATDDEFANRDDGLPGMEETYDFSYGTDNIKEMQIGLQYDAISNDEVNTTMVFQTDSQIEENDLEILEDNQEFFPAYHAAVGIHEDILEEYPEIEDITQEMSELLDGDIMRELNYKVDIEGESVDDVAKEWLEENDLL